MESSFFCGLIGWSFALSIHELWKDDHLSSILNFPRSSGRNEVGGEMAPSS